MDISSLTILEEAPWPSLLLDQTGHIVLSNKCARSWLGIGPLSRPKLQTLLSVLDGASVIDFESGEPESNRNHRVLRTLRVKSGPNQPYMLTRSPLRVDGEDYRLLQFFRVAEDPAPKKAELPKPEPAKQETPKLEPPKQEEQKPDKVSEASTTDTSAFLKQKLDCALQLTRTVSLDFNNALTNILGHTSHLLSQTEPTHPWRPSLLAVEKSAERAAEIAHDLAAFSRQEKDTRAHVAGNLNSILRQTVEILQKSVSSNIAWRLDLKKHIHAAIFDEAKFQQAIVKILDNAIQAVGESGTISIKTANVQIESEGTTPPQGIPKGSFVRIEIVDTGPGIEGDILPRVFEPFFTTKANPPHRGLGLTWVYGIITNHGGRVGIASEPGEGCCVTIHMPSLPTTVKEVHDRDKDLAGKNSGTILFVDDEEMLLTMGETILSSSGYSVITAKNGEEALRRFKKAADAIDLVITDIVMPNMSGRELIEKLRVIDPDLNIICSSGYTPSDFKRSGLGSRDVQFLQKPFTSLELLSKVKQALAQTP